MPTTPERELQWAAEDLRCAERRLDAAQRALDDAHEEWMQCYRVLLDAQDVVDRQGKLEAQVDSH